MFTKALILSVLVLVASFGNHHDGYIVVNALPNGSPVCIVGGPAVRASHTSNPNNITGAIEAALFAVKIGNKTLNSTAVNAIAATVDLPVELTSTNGTEFRGVLVVLNGNNSLVSNLFISPNSTDYKAQVNCSTAGDAGFTHISNGLKSNFTATMNLPYSESAFLDVNIVVVNREISIYYHTRYMLLGDPAPPTTKSPTKAPTTTKSPTKKPTKKPTKAPTKAPTNSTVTKAPTKAPTRKACGLFKLSIICLNGCGLFGRILGLCD